MATIKQPKKVASNPNTGKKPTTKKKTNPEASKAKAKHKHRKASNPRIGSWKDIIIGGLVGLGTAVAARNLPQMLLADKNEGMTGYLANAGVTAVCAVAADHFIGTSAGFAAAVGGGGIVLDRVLTDKVSPIGKYLALKGVGDPSAHMSLKGIREGWYLRRDANNQPIIPHQYQDAALDAFDKRQASFPAPTPGLTGTGRRAPRFARAA